MKKIRQLYMFLHKKYTLLSLKKYTTIAGTLVFFFIMSVVPLAFWLTLIVGRLPVNTEQILQLSVFRSVKDVLGYIQEEAANATTSVSVILLFTTLYSSTNLFYQMRRSGELIYDFHRPKQGLKLRIGALALMLIVILMIAAFVVFFALGTFLFSRIFSDTLERIADYSLLAVLAYALALLLNMYICPHKLPPRYFLLGTTITVAAWAVAVTGFAVYLRISNMDKLYGALSTLIVFLLWLYVLMICFVVGVILNSERVERVRANRRARRQRQKKTRQAEPISGEGEQPEQSPVAAKPRKNAPRHA